MKRREYLLGSSVVVTGVAGCLGSSNKGLENDPNGSSEPTDDEISGQDANGDETTRRLLYDKSEEEGMELTIESFPDDWEKKPDDYSPGYDGSFLKKDESAFLLLNVRVGWTIEEVKDLFEDSKETSEGSPANTGNSRDIHEIDIGDEAFWYEDANFAVTVFRHSNGYGQTVSSRLPDGTAIPDPERSQKYARKMFEKW